MTTSLPKDVIRIHRDNEDIGYFTLKDARVALLDGRLREDDWAYQDGLSGWVFLSVLLSSLPHAVPPPLPPIATIPRVPDTSPLSCPRCDSTQLATHRKSFDVGWALAGFFGLLIFGFLIFGLIAILSPVGLLAGFMNAKLNTTCLRCGHTRSRPA